MEIGSCVKCAETFSACGCGSKAAEDAPVPADPRVSPLNEGLYTPSDSPEMAAEGWSKTKVQIEIGDSSGQTKGYRNRIFSVSALGWGDGSIDYLIDDLETLIEERVAGWNATYDYMLNDLNAENPPVPADPRVSPLSEGLHTPSNTPTMAAEDWRTRLNVCRGCGFSDYDDEVVWRIDGMCRNCKSMSGAESFGAEPELVGGPCEICGEDLFRDYDDSMGDVCLSCYYEERSKKEDEGSEYDGWLLNFAESFAAEDDGSWQDENKVQECANLWREKEWANEDNDEEQTDYWGSLFSEKYEKLSASEQQECQDILGSMGAESFAAESQKLGIIYRIDRDDKTADILGVLPSYAEGKKAMTYMFKSALEEYSEDSGEDLMSFSDGKKEFEWDESRSKKKKSLDFYHPTGYEDIIIVLQEYKIETLMDFYGMINEGKFSAETFNAESFGAESKFDKLAKEIAEEYEEKGKSPKEAMEIGEATAANIGRAKFGKRKFAKMGQKAEDDIDFDKSKADRNKDGRISDWERAVGNKVAKGIRESKRAEVGPHVPTRIAATTTPRGVVKTYTSIPAGDGHVVGQFTPDMDYAPSGMYGAESLTSSIEKGFGAVLGIMSGLIVGGFAMGAVSSLSKDDENRE